MFVGSLFAFLAFDGFLYSYSRGIRWVFICHVCVCVWIRSVGFLKLIYLKKRQESRHVFHTNASLVYDLTHSIVSRMDVRWSLRFMLVVETIQLRITNYVNCLGTNKRFKGFILILVA